MEEGSDELRQLMAATSHAASTSASQAAADYELKLTEDFVQRLAMLNPVATTLLYERISTAIFTHLVGLSPSGSRLDGSHGHCATTRIESRGRGMCGVPFCASAVTELNARRSMHFHACIMGGTPPALLSNIAGHDTLQRLACQALDSMFTAHAPIELHVMQAARNKLKVKAVRHTYLPTRDYDINSDQSPQCNAFVRAATHVAISTGTRAPRGDQTRFLCSPITHASCQRPMLSTLGPHMCRQMHVHVQEGEKGRDGLSHGPPRGPRPGLARQDVRARDCAQGGRRGQSRDGDPVAMRVVPPGRR